jgi:hypothetical protein
MSRDLTYDEQRQIEALIDAAGAAAVLVAVANICGEKAEHIASNWQDANLAKRWTKLGGKVDDIVLHAVGL